jgi:hypothetical protein
MRSFSFKYVEDWNTWSARYFNQCHATTVLFGQILRKWRATRPRAMRRPQEDSLHDPPFLDDLVRDAGTVINQLGSLTVRHLEQATDRELEPLHCLWQVLVRLARSDDASCLGISKAVMLLTYGRIGPAFDSNVRRELMIPKLPQSSIEWVASLRNISSDVNRFESRYGIALESLAPDYARHVAVGRAYDMLVGPRQDSSGSGIIRGGANPPVRESP